MSHTKKEFIWAKKMC